MKKTSFIYWAAVALATVAVPRVINAATNYWSGASGVDTNWSTAGNWSPASVPGLNDDAIFFDTGGAVDNLTPSSAVTANTTISHLWVGQTNGFQNIQINAGVTLTIAGTNDNGWGPLGSDPNNAAPDPLSYHSTLYVGTKATNSTTVTADFLGNGTLVVSNLNNEINVRQSNPSSSGTRNAILDLSGLDTFVAKLGRIRVGDGEAQPLNRTQGQLYLAKTNNITLSGTNYQDNVQLVVGNNDVNANGTSTMLMGQQTTINVDQILVGGKKQAGVIRNTNTYVSPTLVLRGSDGVSRNSLFRIGDESDQTGSGNGATGTADFTAGPVDILSDHVIVGKSQQISGSSATGQLRLGGGTFDVNTLDVAHITDGNTAANAVTGNLLFTNTTVKVNTLLQLGYLPSAGIGPRNAGLELIGGSLTVAGAYINQGTVNMTNISAVLAFAQPATLNLNILVLDGGTISNAAVVKATNSLQILDGGAFLGNPAFDMGNNVSVPANWDVSGAPGGGLTVSNSFFGGGNYSGALVQGNGGVIGAGGDGTAGSLNISGNVTLNAGTLKFDFSPTAGGVNDIINIGGTLTLNATNDVFITALGGSFDLSNPYTLITSSGITGNETYFRPAGPLASSRYIFTFDTTGVPNMVRMTVGGTGAKNLTWVGGLSGNLWDAKNTANWNDGSGASQFFSLDNVTFNDTGLASPAVNLGAVLIPGAMVVNNTAQAYGFGGAGGLSASGALTKSGTNSLTFTNGSGNSFSSLVTVNGGTVMFGNAGQNVLSSGLSITAGSVVLGGNSTNMISTSDGSTAINVAATTSLTISNAGADVFPGTIELDGTMIYNQSVNNSLDASINGNGTLVKSGSGALTVNGANGGLGTAVQINGGTIKAGSTTALGGTGVAVANGATLDLFGKVLSVPVVVSGMGVGGNGAIVNSGAVLELATPNAAGDGLTDVTLVGDTALGGPGSWDTDPVKNLGVWGITGTLNTGSTNFNLIKVGPNQVSLSGSVTVDPALGNIDVQQGMLAFQGSVSSMGDPGSNITVRAGALVSFFDTTTAWDKKFILFGDGVTPNLFNYDGMNTIVGSVNLNGNCVIGGAPAARGTPIQLSLNGPVFGTGNLIKPSQDVLSLGGTNTYSGTTSVSGGTLSVDGVNQGAGMITVSAGGTLGGVGIIHSPVTIASGGALAPGNTNTPMGTLTISNTLMLAGTTTMDLNKAGAVLTSDLVTNISTLSLGGTLQLNATGDPLAAGDAFKIFSFTTANGAVAAFDPPTPGDGLMWDTSTLKTDGKIRVSVAQAAPPGIGTITISGGQVVVTGTNGPASGNYYVLTSTNVSLPVSSWTSVATNAFNNGNFSFTNTVSPNVSRQFYIIQEAP